ncbi:unnamed protein product [Vitrella brassicaformis CCMP3155]|uniref:Uncharacterized protein n=1 Tax=Vitrella brassicaformis (strain CCMP3155) TaxID=1169540 RepID=A0A0G4E9T2_VITBC|nr:unnamed protein product [Vitrella brassicaformis CCMP3155]|eukprot:CEL91942.1 unnamed protein product [Vitrella brassicaformis CCMP3155]
MEAARQCRDVGTQVHVPPREYISPQVLFSQPDDAWPDWIERPHTISWLMLAISLIYTASTCMEASDPPPDTRKNVTAGLLAGIAMFLVFAMVQLPDGILIRPHPVIWRAVKGVSILYLFLVIFLLFQSLDDVRVGLKFVDPKLGVPLPEKNYAEDCRLYTPDSAHSRWANLKEQLDVFVVAHLIGWMVKALIIRDWDHIILDVIGCNAVGIYLGLRLCRFFKVKEYKWVIQSPKRRLFAKGLLSRFLPYAWTDYHWPGFLSNLETFWGLVLYGFCVTLVDLNVFLLKNLLWLQPHHFLIVLRTALFASACASATREFYEYLTDRNCTRLGMQCWLTMAMLSTELLLVWKWRGGFVVVESMPWPIAVANGGLLFAACMVTLRLSVFRASHEKTG